MLEKKARAFFGASKTGDDPGMGRCLSTTRTRSS